MKKGEKKNQKSKIAYVNFSAGENSSTQIPAINTIFMMEKHILFIQFTIIMHLQKMDILLIAKD